MQLAAFGLGAPTLVKDGLSKFGLIGGGSSQSQDDPIPKTDPKIPDPKIPNVVDVPDTSKGEKTTVIPLGDDDFVPFTAPDPKPEIVDTVTRPEPKTGEQIVNEKKTTKTKTIQISPSLKGNSKVIFSGHGTTFEGGAIREIDIGRRSTGQIATKNDITASQAANIRARTGSQDIAIRNKGESDEVANARKTSDALFREKYKNFNFGTNTGSGIGSVTAANSKIGNKLPSKGAVSNSQFAGLSAEQIAQRLTGGNINNF